MAHWASGKEILMVLEKRQLNLQDIEAQTALELPDRETLATVVISCLAVCVGQIQIRNVNVSDVADVCAQVVANIAALNTVNGQVPVVSCDIRYSGVVFWRSAE